MFTYLFLTTTNPRLSWNKFFSINLIFLMILSIFFHTFIYTVFFNTANYIYFGRILNNNINTRLISCLLIIMTFGYIGRFLHSKQVYKDYKFNIDKTNNYLNTHYNSWIFIG